MVMGAAITTKTIAAVSTPRTNFSPLASTRRGTEVSSAYLTRATAFRARNSGLNLECAESPLKIFSGTVKLGCRPELPRLTARRRPGTLVGSEEYRMAKLALIYGMRLLPEEDLGEVRDATVVLKNGRTARITMHLIEGSKEEIEVTFHQSVQAFFEMYPEI